MTTKTFNNCSLIFSSSSFMPTTSFCMAASLALEPKVFTSRPISWAIKPNFLPLASSVFKRFDEIIAMGFQGVSFPR